MRRRLHQAECTSKRLKKEPLQAAQNKSSVPTVPLNVRQTMCPTSRNAPRAHVDAAAPELLILSQI